MCLFCKRKTAYEWRISDWSSDVGSSDLVDAQRRRCDPPARVFAPACDAAGEVDVVGRAETTGPVEAQRGLRVELERQALGIAIEDAGQTAYPGRVALRGEAQAFDARVRGQRAAADRSEEHTSGLQSLMRNSSADFA